MKEILPEITPKTNIPYRSVNGPFRFGFVIPGKGIKIEQDANGILFVGTESGLDVADLVAGDNIEFARTDDGKVVVSVVNTVANVAAGQNVTINIDPETGTAIINSVIDENQNEHYQGVFDTPQDLMEYDSDPEEGDYGLVKKLVYSDGGEITWNGEYKYCFWINGTWTVVDQMLTFTTDQDLLRQFYSVGGGSPVIYLHKIAQTGRFTDLEDKPIVATPEVEVEGTTVSVTCETEGAEIHYTTDGSMPHAGSALYSGPITVVQTTDFRFVAVKNGMINSQEATASVDYDLEAPVIDMDFRTGEVTITNPNVDGNDDPVGEIHYTLDGSEPTSASPVYTEPFILTISFGNQKTVKAVVYNSGTQIYSSVTGETYLRTYLASNGYLSGITGEIGDFYYVYNTVNGGVASDGEIAYTIDGSDPDYSSPRMTKALTFNRYEQTVLKIKGFRPGQIPTTVSSQTLGYAEPTAPEIVFDPQTNTITLNRAGNLLTSPEVPLKTDVNEPNIGCRIFYSIEESGQTGLYTGPFSIDKELQKHRSLTITAYVIAYGRYASQETTEEIKLILAPTYSLDHRTGMLTLENPNSEGNIYYTLDGSEPSKESTRYTEPFTLSEETVLKMVVITDEGQSRTITEEIKQADAPVINEAGLNVSTGEYDVVMTGVSGEDIKYTDNGSKPSGDSQTYNEPIERNMFDGAKTYKSIAIEEGKIPSVVTTLVSGQASVTPPTITVDDETHMATLALAGNTVDIPLQTNNNVPSMGARIWYTLDGTEPSAQNGTLWTGTPFAAVNFGEIRAKTICYGEYESESSVISRVRYLTLTAEYPGDVYVSCHFEGNKPAPSIDYSVNNGPFEKFIFSGDLLKTSNRLSLNIGDSVRFRGENSISTNEYIIINSTGSVAGSGVPYTVFQGDGDNYDEAIAPKMSGLLSGCRLTIAPELPAVNLTEGCYSALFSGTNLTQAPVLPATTIPNKAYYQMFDGCRSLLSTPVLPATSLGEHSYFAMFRNCVSLNNAYDLPAITLPNNCYALMFAGCVSLTTAPAISATAVGVGSCSEMFKGCSALRNISDFQEIASMTTMSFGSMFENCTSIERAPLITFLSSGQLSLDRMFYGCTSLNYLKVMATGAITSGSNSEDWLSGVAPSGTFIYSDGANWPTGASGIPSGWKSAAWNTVLDESDLTDDDVAIVLKNTTTGNLGYMPKDDFIAEAFDPELFTIKPYIRFTRGKNGKPVFMHKNQTSGMWAEFNRYRLACDTTQPGSFDWSVTINGSAHGGSVSWQAGDTLDSILAQLNTQAVATYLVFSHESGENFIRIRKGGYSYSVFTLSNNTGATLTDLSLYTKIEGVQQAETHREWQDENVSSMFPDLGFIGATTVQYAKNGYNLSYMCGGNENQYKAYFRTHGSSSYLPENAVSSRMTEAAFNAMDGSGDADQQALYDKYDGSWDAYMEASMVNLDDTHADGIEYLSYDNGDTQTVALASVTTMDFDGSYIPVFPCAVHCQNFTDIDVENSKFNMNTEHELAVFMRNDKMAAINSAMDILIAQGMTADKLSATAYYYWSVARSYSYIAWLYNRAHGYLNTDGLYCDLAARPLAYPVQS